MYESDGIILCYVMFFLYVCSNTKRILIIKMYEADGVFLGMSS